MPPPCPDCGAEIQADRTLTHQPSCPIQLGVDAATDDDRKWFADNPGAEIRERPMSHAERQQLAHTDARFSDPLAPDRDWTVLVTEVRPGFRLRLLTSEAGA